MENFQNQHNLSSAVCAFKDALVLMLVPLPARGTKEAQVQMNLCCNARGFWERKSPDECIL